MQRRPIHLMAVFGHPDDESFIMGGTFAELTDLGIPVTLICATRGEAGEISDPALATPENLAEVREQELRNAMAAVGVDDVRFLDYRDSGMEGTPENGHPRSLYQAPVTDVTRQIAALLREVRPTIVVTFGPEGLYGHPDHVKMGEATTAAVLLLADEPERRPDALYYAVQPRERFVEMASREGGPFEDTPPKELATMGTPREEITTTIDVSASLPRKRAALTAHRTQFGDDNPLNTMSEAEVEEFLREEYFIQVPLPWEPALLGDPLATLVSSMASVGRRGG